MRGFIARLLTGRGASPAGTADPLTSDLDQALARRRAERKPRPVEWRRFARARPMVERLRAEMGEGRAA